MLSRTIRLTPPAASESTSLSSPKARGLSSMDSVKWTLTTVAVVAGSAPSLTRACTREQTGRLAS